VSSEGEEASWSINDGIAQANWSNEVRETTKGLRQGQAVALPPFFFYASAEQPVHSLAQDWAAQTDRPAGVVNLLSEEPRPPYGLIATQTCDLVEEGKPKRPWVQLAPTYVYRCSAGESQKIKQGRAHGYFCWASGLPEVEGGLWVADLRILLPIEKGWLVGRELQEGFADEAGYEDFASRLASHFARIAYSSRLQSEVFKPLKAVLAEITEIFQGEDGIVQVGLELGRNRLDPQSVRICFIGDQPLAEAVREHLSEWWTRTFGGQQSSGLQVLAPEFTDYDQLSARRYASLGFLPISG